MEQQHKLTGKLGTLSMQLLQNAVGEDRKGNVLVIYHASLSPPDTPCLRRDENSFGMAFCLSQGKTNSTDELHPELECVSQALPFQDEVFQIVVLYHVIEHGDEAELAEACRVLVQGGEIFVLGLNRASWGNARTYRNSHLTAMRPGFVQSALVDYEMQITAKIGLGLLGQKKPLMGRQKLSSLALPLADLVLIQARHREKPAVTRMLLKKVPAGAMPAALTT
jgi:SAM-dependent methyltransferase